MVMKWDTYSFHKGPPFQCAVSHIKFGNFVNCYLCIILVKRLYTTSLFSVSPQHWVMSGILKVRMQILLCHIEAYPARCRALTTTTCSRSQESLFLIPWLRLECWLARTKLALYLAQKKRWKVIYDNRGHIHSGFSCFDFLMSHLYREAETWLCILW